MGEARVNGDDGCRRRRAPGHAHPARGDVTPVRLPRIRCHASTTAGLHEGGQRYEKALAKGESIAAADLNPEQRDYIDDKIQERLALPRDEWPEDALTRFLVTEVDGETLEPRNIRAQIMFMIGAGSETTKNLIGNLIYRLGLDPDAYAALRADPALIDVGDRGIATDGRPRAVHGAQLPASPPSSSAHRSRKEPKVLMCIGSGNHDETKYDDPDTFRLDRAYTRAPVVRLRPAHLSGCDARPARNPHAHAGVHEADRCIPPRRRALRLAPYRDAAGSAISAHRHRARDGLRGRSKHWAEATR